MGIKLKLKYWLKHKLSNLLEEKLPVLITSNKLVIAGVNSFHNGNFHVRGSNTKLAIGSYCAIGKDVKIILSNHSINNVSIQYSFYKSNFGLIPNRKQNPDISVTIGSDVWLGDNVIVLPNVNIGHGCVVGAGSVVTKSIEPYSVVVGIPAKRIRYRFNNETINDLLKSEWWTWDSNKIKENKAFFFKKYNI